MEIGSPCHDSLNAVTEEEARRRLVPSKTTLLGLIKNASFVEGVWFDQAVTGRPYDDIGIARRDGSFRRDRQTQRVGPGGVPRTWEASRKNLDGRRSDEKSTGVASGPSGR